MIDIVLLFRVFDPPAPTPSPGNWAGCGQTIPQMQIRRERGEKVKENSGHSTRDFI